MTHLVWEHIVVERPSELVKTLRVRPFSVPISTLASASLADTLAAAMTTQIATKGGHIEVSVRDTKFGCDASVRS
jgi:hypothetical protein